MCKCCEIIKNPKRTGQKTMAEKKAKEILKSYDR